MTESQGLDSTGPGPWIEDVARRTQSVHDMLVERLGALAGAAGADGPAAEAFNASHEQARELFLGTMDDVLRSAAELMKHAQSPDRGGDDDQASAKTSAANP